MSAKPYKPGQALGFAVLIWVVGFVWGSIVFMTPALHAAPLPFVSSNPAISFPILVMWFFLAAVLARLYLRNTGDKEVEGVKLGVTFALVNILLDLVVLVLLLKAGFNYFLSLSVLFAYTMLVLVPWFVGRRYGASERI